MACSKWSQPQKSLDTAKRPAQSIPAATLTRVVYDRAGRGRVGDTLHAVRYPYQTVGAIWDEEWPWSTILRCRLHPYSRLAVEELSFRS